MTSDVSSYSDAEVENRLSHNRSRSFTGNYVLYSLNNRFLLLYRIPPVMSDVSSYSDAEVEDRLSHNRSRSLTGNYVLYSPDNHGKLTYTVIFPSF